MHFMTIIASFMLTASSNVPISQKNRERELYSLINISHLRAKKKSVTEVTDFFVVNLILFFYASASPRLHLQGR